jgi:hypothetical protein
VEVGRADRGGRPDRQADLAVDALDRLSQTTAVSGTDWALGIEARCRALLSEEDAAEPLYRQAVERLERTRIRVELTRAHLLYGEWPRRECRRVDAREQLRIAHELFSEFGMEAFAERARLELEATGEHTRKRTVDTLDDLTSQQAQISDLAADGATNREIAAHLFISQHRRLPPAQNVPQARSEVPPPTQTAPAPATRTHERRGSGVLRAWIDRPRSAESVSIDPRIRFPESSTRPADTDAPGPAPDYEGADYALRDAMTAHRCDCRPSPAKEGSHEYNRTLV